jgi:hypothetical protein
MYRLINILLQVAISGCHFGVRRAVVASAAVGSWVHCSLTVSSWIAALCHFQNQVSGKYDTHTHTHTSVRTEREREREKEWGGCCNAAISVLL